MRLFNIFRKKYKNILRSSPKEQLGYLLEYMPDFYKDQRQYINAIDYFEHYEWALTLESLIELTEETDHYFSEQFWEILAHAAKAVKMKELSTYCSEQIIRNQQDLKSKTPFGWTTVKIDDTHFQHHIAEKLKKNG